MRWFFFAILVLHGLIHFVGVAKAFDLVALPQLSQPISRGQGILWLGAGLGFLLASVLLITIHRFWWTAGIVAAVLSQIVVMSSWADAKVGSLANLLVVGVALYSFASSGPVSFRAQYRQAVRTRLANITPSSLVTDVDLALLPDPVQRYLRLTGVVGQPRAVHFGASWYGRIRETADDPWMPFTAEQQNFVDEPARFFHMHAHKGIVPVDVFHTFQAASARMQVRLLSTFPIVDARSSELTRAETVTLFNDLCLLAPSALIDPTIRWDPIDGHSTKAYYTVGTNTISAVLVFNQIGELVDFISDDRLVASADGSTFTRQQWSTPVGNYQDFGPRRVATRGEGRWHPPEGEFTYVQVELLSLVTNGAT